VLEAKQLKAEGKAILARRTSSKVSVCSRHSVLSTKHQKHELPVGVQQLSNGRYEARVSHNKQVGGDRVTVFVGTL
jgi:hypothetical protein